MLEFYPEIKDFEEEDCIIQESSILDFKKIQKIKYGDPIISEKISFSSFTEFYGIENGQDGMLQADYPISYLEYKFFKKYGITPMSLTLQNDTIGSNFYDSFYKHMNIPSDSFSFSHSYDNKDMELTQFYCSMEKMILFFNGHYSHIVYHPEYAKEGSPLMVLLGIIKNYKLPAVPKNKIYVVYRGQGGFQKKSFSVKKRNIKIEENYNDDFPEISNDIITKLNYKGKTGLVILHGSPGTGKCVIGKTKITVRNKKTGIIEDRYIEDLM